MKSVEDLTREVFSNPTAPYREHWVLECVKSELNRIKVPFFTDIWGNIIAGVRNETELRKSSRTALVAHTDHPGFHLIKKLDSSRWRAKWYGGCPPHISKARVAIHNPESPDSPIYGTIEDRKLSKEKIFVIKLSNKKDGINLNSKCFGAFDFPSFQKRRTRIFTRAADDLTGVVIILATFARLKASKRKFLIGIFTRAEETGFRGTLGLIYSRILGKEMSTISLEASRALQGARLGKGPVIRLGDKRSLFDSSVTSGLDLAASDLVSRNSKIKFQRRIMNGGTCEATAFNFHGTPSGGLAIPLGNYHNQRSNGRPGAEFIDIRDLETGVKLCLAFFKNNALRKNPVLKFKSLLKKEFKKDKKLLMQKVEFKMRVHHV